LFPGTFAAATPDKAAVVMSDSGLTLTYAELDDRSTRLARHLRGAGLSPGDGVALMAENRVEYFEVYWAGLRSGLYVVPVNHHLKPHEIAHMINDSGAKALVVSSAYGDAAQTVAGETPAVQTRLAFGAHVPGYDDYAAALSGSSAEPLADQPRGQDMFYTSGTTGVPKGVLRPLPGEDVSTYRDPFLDIYGDSYGFDSQSVFLSPAPLYHGGPLRFSRMVHEVGGTAVIMPKFDAQAALYAIERYRVTHSQWVPTMFVRMLKLPREQRLAADLSSHRVAIHAAAACPVEVKRLMIDWWGTIIEEYYGSIEGIGSTRIDSSTWLRKPGSVGAAALGVIHICGENGSELPTGTIGLIYFEREHFPFAYHHDPDKTAKAKHPQHGNWGTAGDIGYVDDDGYLYITDRKAFTIISGGVNIYPQEIEDALTLHPAVLDVAVIGVPDDDLGERVLAVVQSSPGCAGSDELGQELIAFLRERIAHYKVPRSIIFVTKLPRTPTGKLQKHDLRVEYGSAHP
jgi:long-chain acyl-CoA synthetase